MADMRICAECGRQYDAMAMGRERIDTKYCSAKCERDGRAAEAAKYASYSSGSSSADLSRRMKLIVPAVGIILIIGLILFAVDRVKNAFSPIKIDTVSASCDTQEKFVSIINKAISGVSVTRLEGEEFSTYGRQAFDAVKEREGKYARFKDSVYFVRLPDKVNVYIWFQTEDATIAYVYKTN